MNKTTTDRSGIISAGLYAIDYIKRVDNLPAPGTVSRILMEQVSNGGHAYNILINLVRLGAHFKLKAAGWVGQDVDGRAVLEDCAAHHIDTRWLRLSKADHTSYNDVMVRPETGERSILARMGAHARLSGKDIDWEQCQAKFLHLGPVLGLGDLDARHKLSGTRAAEFLRLAQKTGMWTALSMIPISSLRQQVFDALRFTDYLFLNEEDVATLTNRPVRFQGGLHTDSIRAIGDELLDRGIGKAVILRLSEGVFFIPRKGKTIFVSGVNLPVKRLVSEGGVDSAFTAGVLYGLHEQIPLSETLRIGLGAATACSMDLTTSGGVRTAGKCLEIYRRYERKLVA